jgi:hypothetical protein
MSDIRFENHGSIALLIPLSVAGQEWLDENVDPDAQTWGGGIAVEPRYVDDILLGVLTADLGVE